MNSLLNIIAASRRRTSLRTNLVEWWDMVDLTGKHAGNVLSNIGTSATGPFGANTARAMNSAASQHSLLNSLLTASNNWTIAFIGNMTGVNRDLFVANNGATTALTRFRCSGTAEQYSAIMANGTSSQVFTASSGFSAQVYSKTSATSATVRVGDDLGNTSSIDITGPNAPDAFTSFLNADRYTVSAIVLASRAWTATDFAAFHNGGIFLRYANI
jgi:hypothetical protein